MYDGGAKIEVHMKEKFYFYFIKLIYTTFINIYKTSYTKIY